MQKYLSKHKREIIVSIGTVLFITGMIFLITMLKNEIVASPGYTPVEDITYEINPQDKLTELPMTGEGINYKLIVGIVSTLLGFFFIYYVSYLDNKRSLI